MESNNTDLQSPTEAESTTSVGIGQRPQMIPHVVAAGIASALALGAYLSWTVGPRQAALFVVGLLAGVILYHAAFGFGGAWRNLIDHRRGAGMRAQLVMLALTVIVFVPLLSGGELFGTSLRGSAAPLSISLLAGAFMFGVGMQLGGGCASGTLFTVGGGNMRMVVTLVAFIVGSVGGAWQFDAWQTLPRLPPVSLPAEIGPLPALAASLVIMAVIWGVTVALERARHGTVQEDFYSPQPRQWLSGPWPLLFGALGLVAVNCATLLLAGRPWGITSGFALWGSKFVATLGVDVAAWPYWQSASRASALQAGVLNNITSVMNFGILLGALIAAGLAGRFAPVWRIPLRSAIAAVIGGLLLGYGARIAYGCNIGAFFGGVASASLHGWLWFVAAFAGNIVGAGLRPRFKLGE
jgi:uncharacterized membrane protein YedE/YeeE